MADQPVNLVVIGAAGVGKSTLLDYLSGGNEFGGPHDSQPTPKGFFFKETKMGGVPVRLIDTWGIESNKTKEWLSYFDEEVARRDALSDIGTRFHGVLYLIDAAMDRLHQFELVTLKYLVQRRCSVTVVLTKARKASEQTIQILRTLIAGKFGDEISVVAVESKRETLRDGNVSSCFGRDAIEHEVIRLFWKTVRAEIPLRVGKLLEQQVVDKWDRYCDRYLRSFFARMVWLSSLAYRLKRRSKTVVNTLNRSAGHFYWKEIGSIKKQYPLLAESLDLSTVWKSSDDIGCIESVFDASVVAPSHLELFISGATFRWYDPLGPQLAKLDNAALEFSQQIKKEIQTRLVPELDYLISKMRLKPIKRSERDDGLINRLISRIRSR